MDERREGGTKKPGQLAEPISRRTLRMIDEVVENFRRGIVSPSVDPERLSRLAS